MMNAISRPNVTERPAGVKRGEAKIVMMGAGYAQQGVVSTVGRRDAGVSSVLLIPVKSRQKGPLVGVLAATGYS